MMAGVRLAKTCALRKLTPWSRKTEVSGAIRCRKSSACRFFTYFSEMSRLSMIFSMGCCRDASYFRSFYFASSVRLIGSK